MKRMRDLLAVLANRHRGWIRGFTAALAALAMLVGMAGAGSIAFADEVASENGDTTVESMDDRTDAKRQAEADATENGDTEDVVVEADMEGGDSENGGPERMAPDGSSQERSDGQQSQQTENQPETGDQPAGGQSSAGSDGLSEDGDAPVQNDDCKDDAGQSGANGTTDDVADTEADGDGADDADDDDDANDDDKNGAEIEGKADDKDADDETNDSDGKDDKDGKADEDEKADDADDDHIMRERFTFNRKTVMRAAANETVPSPDHTKSIVYNGGGKYTLNLDVVGKDTRETQEITSKIEVVLVLDTSGSMDFCMNGRQEGCDDANPRRLDALKTAADSFIDATAATNATIRDENSKVRIAITRFGRNSGTVLPLTSDATVLKSSVNSLSAVGATPADQGMDAALNALNQARQGAKKIVIFFTDGVPTTQSDFSRDVANRAVRTARTMKAAGALVYSIGIFDGANPEQESFNNRREDDQANQFMHAVSSNYPDATAYNQANWGQGSNLGYYKATNSADDLKRIFDDIQQEITTGSAYSGVSIVDELSAYAQVDGVTWNTAETRTIAGNTYYRVTGGATLNVTNLPAGAQVPREGTDYTIWYGDAGSGGNGTIRVEFADDYELKHDATYTLSYGIVPTDQAYARVDMVDGGINYDATGDGGTGETSAGKPGFRSNASAQVCYTFDRQSDCVAYQHPVLQVPSADVVVTKHWEGGTPSGSATLRIDLMQDGASMAGRDLSEDDALPTGEWQMTFHGMMPGDYTVTEGTIAGYGAKDGVTSAPISITRADMWAAFDEGRTATYEASFTNVRQTVAALPLSGATNERTWLIVAGTAALILLLAGILGLAVTGCGRPL